MNSRAPRVALKETGGSEPRVVVTPRDLAVHGRRIGSSVLLGWQTRRPVDFVLAEVRRISGDAHDADEASMLLREEDEEGNDEFEGPSAELVRLALSQPAAVLAASVRFPGLHFAWILGDGTHDDTETAGALATCNARIEPYEHRIAELLLGSTAIAWDAENLVRLEQALDM